MKPHRRRLAMPRPQPGALFVPGWLALLAALVLPGASGCVPAQQDAGARAVLASAAATDTPILLARSGGFIAGGRTIQNPRDADQHLSCDHGYVEYFLPVDPRRTSLVMWHSSSTQVWQNRWDGGEGFKDMFLRRGYPVYLWDGPRVGRATWSCEPLTLTPRYRDEQNFTAWNFGPGYGSWWPGLQFPVDDANSWQQATASRYEEFDTLQNILIQTEAAAVAADSGRLGDRIVYLTNSAAGLRALVTATRAGGDNIAGIVAYESMGYVFPVGDPESPAFCTDPQGCGFGPIGVTQDEFRKLARLKSIRFVWGDNRAGTSARALDQIALSRLCARLINKYGGNAQVVMLREDSGLTGNTHIPFADLNNAEVAALLDVWLAEAGLDGRGGAGRQ